MVMREPWRDRRKRLEDIFEDKRLPRVGLVPVTDDVARLYQLWVGVGGEGIVLREPGSIYQPGIRTTAWLKLKPKLTLRRGGGADGPTPAFGPSLSYVLSSW
jgi:ATP-dependent DNA ligase